MSKPTVAQAESSAQAILLPDLGSLIAGLADTLHEQIDEYKSLLEDVVETATGRSLWAPCGLADAGADYQTLNRKSNAIWYLLAMIGEKAQALEEATSKLRNSAVPTIPRPARQPRVRTARRRAA